MIEYSHLISDEISKSIDFFLSQANDRSVDAIFTCGGGVNLLGLNEVLKEKMPAKLKLENITNMKILHNYNQELMIQYKIIIIHGYEKKEKDKER